VNDLGSTIAGVLGLGILFCVLCVASLGAVMFASLTFRVVLFNFQYALWYFGWREKVKDSWVA
jgi:hypothetical protein